MRKVISVLFGLLAATNVASVTIERSDEQLPFALAPNSKPNHPSHSNYKALPSLKEQDEMERRWVAARYEHIPQILAKYGYDALLMSQREYAEDTVFKSLVSSTTTFSARRRTVYLFHSSNVTETGVANPSIWIDNTAAVWDSLNATLTKINPNRIAINIDPDLAFSDGLHTGEGRNLISNLHPVWRSRLDSERMIPVEIVSYRAGGPEQLTMYKLMMENVWAMIAEGFSSAVVTPGVTTANDLEWWFRSRMQVMNVTTWFHPTVNVFGPNRPRIPYGTDHGNANGPIMVGEMLHVDIGITAMNMNTDTQHLGYVLRENETIPPMGLIDGLRKSNRLQDLVRQYMQPGKSGDQVLREVRKQMADEGLKGLIYCHPIGDYGHAAGALIGMTNLQEGVPVGGELPMLRDSWYSVELAAHSFVPEWNLTQSFMQEEDVYWSDKTHGWNWVRGRQEHFHLVGHEGSV